MGHALGICTTCFQNERQKIGILWKDSMVGGRWGHLRKGHGWWVDEGIFGLPGDYPQKITGFQVVASLHIGSFLLTRSSSTFFHDPSYHRSIPLGTTMAGQNWWYFPMFYMMACSLVRFFFFRCFPLKNANQIGFCLRPKSKSSSHLPGIAWVRLHPNAWKNIGRVMALLWQDPSAPWVRISWESFAHRGRFFGHKTEKCF